MRRRPALSVLGMLLHPNSSHSFATSSGASWTSNNPYLDRLQNHREGDDHRPSTLLKPTRKPDEILSSIDDIILQSGLSLDRSEILRRVDEEHARDAVACSSLSVEVDPSMPNDVEYEWIHVQREGKHHPIAIHTIGRMPLLDGPSIQQIRSAAERQWNDPTSGIKSRFTFQRRGNYEAHLDDLAKEDSSIKAIADELLRTKVYPLIRDVFGSSAMIIDDLTSLRFCVYDSLIIRYNATEANNGMDPDILFGAGQPLHRDLGLISVNIMLNSEEEFASGGTAFENQFGERDSQPLKPVGPGHALAHLSSERHAGSSTIEGVRDILVMFITATNFDSSVQSPVAPRLERCARLKAKARGESQAFENSADAALCRMVHQRLAVDASPGDGEAWHYLGMTLRDYHSAKGAVEEQLSLDCLLHAAALTPGDGRLFNNLGLSFGSLYMEQSIQALFHQALYCYSKSAFLHRAAQLAGCDIGQESDAAILNHGLFLANLDRFTEAANVLESATSINDFWRRKDGTSHALEDSEAAHLQIIQDADGLRRFCESKSAEKNLEKDT